MFIRFGSLLENMSRWLRRVITMTLIVANFTTITLAKAASTQTDTQPSFPIRAAFYYPWFPEAWNQQGFKPFTNYTPSFSFYDSENLTTVKQQIAAMQYGGIQAGIASWWGQNSKTDSRIPALLQGAAGTDFRWSVYYENESRGDPPVAQLTSDLTYLRDKYGNDPGFLRVNGRFVVFVYADDKDACGMADRWKQANTVGAYVVLKVFSGYSNCASQPDGWHQYGPAVAADSQIGYSYTISPGFWKKGNSARLVRDLDRWNQNIKDMIASGAPFQLITTFNEWGEGTAVESAQEWATRSGYGAYLDALHNNGQSATSPTAIPSLSPTSSAAATNTPLPVSTLSPIAPTTGVFKPVADATVRAAMPNTNFGKSKQLRIDGSPIIRSYLRFDIQGLSSAVTKATLRVYAKRKSKAGYQVYKVSDATWDETTINYRNAPPLGEMTGAMDDFGRGAWTTVDVTSLVTGNGTISLALVGTNNTMINFVSREGGANAPQLVVSTLTSVEPVTATPAGLPSVTPTLNQTASPTSVPTQVSTATLVPTQAAPPTSAPTTIPSVAPTLGQAASPTVAPTQASTAIPASTQADTVPATTTPTTIPSVAPTLDQAASPTSVPTQASTATPALTQAVLPTNTLTVVLSATPLPTQIIIPTNTATQTASPTSVPTQTRTATATKTATAVPSSSSAIKHVFVVVMENHSYKQVWNTSSSPYITSLGNSFARATNYHATIHPSLPNYLDMFGGGHYSITNDCSPSSSCHINATNLADNLESKGLTWKGYMESMPSPCFLTTSGKYAPKHNPMVYFDDIRNNVTRCNSHNVPYTALAGDLASAATTPNYALIVPNLCNDTHDCSVDTGDTWLKNNLPAILNSPACTVDQCLLILTWDEDDNSQSNQVLTIFAGSGAKTGGVTSGVSYNHFSMLRTIEDIFGLPAQTNQDAAASPMNDLLR